jgi:hypothetical protein
LEEFVVEDDAAVIQICNQTNEDSLEVIRLMQELDEVGGI